MSPRASDGTVTLPVGNPVVAGTAISADVQNATVADLASMIEDSLSRSGKGGMNTAMQFVKSISATPSITFVGDTDTGINSDTGGEVDIVANGTAALTVASTGVTIPGGAANCSRLRCGAALNAEPESPAWFQIQPHRAGP